MERLKYVFFLLMAIAFGCVACDDDDTIDEMGNDEEFRLTRADSLHIATQCAMGVLAVDDSTAVDKLETGVGHFQPDYGDILYQITPTVRYIDVETLSEARDKFLTGFSSVIEFAHADTTAESIYIDLGKYGSIRFAPASGEGHLAEMDVNLGQLPDLTKVVYLHNTAWPDNARKVSQGNTFKSSDGRKWVCIKDNDNGYGYLATFCGKGSSLTKIVDPFLNSHFNSYSESTYTSYLHYGYATEEELRALREFMYDTNGRQRKKCVEALKRIVDDDYISNLYYNGHWFVCGDGSWHRDTTTKYKYTYDHYSRTWHKWQTKTEKSTYIFMSARFFIMFNNRHIIKRENWNSYEVPSYYNRSGSDYLNYARVQIHRFGSDFDYHEAGFTEILR